MTKNQPIFSEDNITERSRSLSNECKIDGKVDIYRICFDASDTTVKEAKASIDPAYNYMGTGIIWSIRGNRQSYSKNQHHFFN